MKTRILIFCLLVSGYSFAQYPSTVVGYSGTTSYVKDTLGARFAPSVFIDAKGKVASDAFYATGLYLKVQNSSALQNVGIGLEMPDKSVIANYGIRSTGVYSTNGSISGISFDYSNSGTGNVIGSTFSITGANSSAVKGASVINSSAGFSRGGTFTGNVVGIPNGDGVAYGVDASGRAGTAYGIRAIAIGTTPSAGVSYGIFARASGAALNYAGYFQGDVTVTGTFNNPSDAKLKQHINPIGDALPKVMQLRPTSYEFKTDTYQEMNFAKGKHYGFLAQEVEKVFPTLVSENPMIVSRTKQMRTTEVNGTTSTANTSKEASEVLVTENIKSVSYLEMIPILTKAIQEQQLQIEALKAEIRQLKSRK